MGPRFYGSRRRLVYGLAGKGTPAGGATGCDAVHGAQYAGADISDAATRRPLTDKAAGFFKKTAVSCEKCGGDLRLKSQL
ncbi:hypothetical protein D3C72_2442400 [compost metagenome]